MIFGKNNIQLLTCPNENSGYSVMFKYTAKGFASKQIEVSRIIKCTSDNNYVIITGLHKMTLQVDSNLRYLARLLKPYHFIQVNDNTLINVNFATDFQYENNSLSLIDGSRISVNENRLNYLLQAIDNLSGNYY